MLNAFARVRSTIGRATSGGSTYAATSMRTVPMRPRRRRRDRRSVTAVAAGAWSDISLSFAKDDGANSPDVPITPDGVLPYYRASALGKRANRERGSGAELEDQRERTAASNG